MRGCDTHPNFRTVLFWDTMYLDNFAPLLGLFYRQAPRTAVNRLQIKSAVSYTRLPFNSVLNLEIEQMIGAEKGCRGDAVLLHFYSPESGNRRQSGVFQRESNRESQRPETIRFIRSVRPSGGLFLGDAIGMRLTRTWLKKQL